MTDAQLITLLLVLAAVSAAVIIITVRSILREMNGLGDDDESQAEMRNKKLMRDKDALAEIEKWREGR